MKTIPLYAATLILSLCLSHPTYPIHLSNTTTSDILTEIARSPEPDSNTIKVALLLDTSNSMDGLIDQARAQLWEIVNELALAKCSNNTKPNLNIALYEYGNDGLDAREGYIRQVNDFSNDLDLISQNLFKLTTNGGNEYCGTVIQNSLDQLHWGKNQEDLNLIFIAGNEPFTQGPVRYQDAASNACEKDVTINTIFCGDYNEGVRTQWKDGSALTKGDYIAINSDEATVHVPSPYDDRIIEYNRKLNNTYVRYGQEGEAKMALQSSQDVNASAYGTANAVKRAVSKSSHFYKNSSWDLVDAVEEDAVDLEEVILSDNIPSELNGKSKKEIEAYITEKKQERTKIQNEIATLNRKREEFLSTQISRGDNELRNAMIIAIKKQGKHKNYIWENK